MKIMKTLFLFLLSACSFIALNAQKVQILDIANLKRYTTNNQDLKNSNQMPIKTVFMGNSITEMWVKSDSAFFKDNNYVGRGIGGQTTPQMLLRFQNDVINLNPEIVVINGGINDIAENTGTYSSDFTFGNIKSMAEIANANGIRVILTSVLPAGKIPWDAKIENVPNKIIELNQKIKEYADANNITYVDYYAEMVDPELAMKAEYTSDGVHVTPVGYVIMENLIKEAIENPNQIDIIEFTF